MKKLLAILLACTMLFTLAGTAVLAEDEQPQPEGGKKFEGNWAVMGGLVEIYYEEEGYRVLVDLCNNEDWSGVEYEYSCYYVENEDALVSISSAKTPYTSDASTFDRTRGEAEYEGMDEDGMETVFTIAENGSLHWADGHDKGAGEDLEFRNIGAFKGAWRSAEGEEPAWVEFTWEGLDEEKYYYSVYLHRGDDETYTECIMTGTYNEETGKLECTGSNVDTEDKETYEAVFSRTEDGKLLYEAANGIVMEYDLLGGSQG